MWYLSTGSTSYRKITLFLTSFFLPLVFWGEEKRKTIVILFQKFKRGCSDSNLSTSWEKSKMRAEGSYSVPSSWAGRRIPGLHRRAASPGAAGWYNPWECRHLPQTHSVKSESGRKEDNVISKWESYKEVKQIHRHTQKWGGKMPILWLSFFIPNTDTSWFLEL